MATRKSQLVLTCNAQAVKDVFNYLNKELERIKNRRDELLKQFEGKMWTAEAKREFKQLGDDIAAITSMQQKNEESMRKYGQVIKDLAGSKLKDLKTALREANTALSKMSERSAGREKLINDIKRIKDQIAGTSGLTMSFSQAQRQLKSLDNISMDKLKQGLSAIKEKLDDPNIGNKWRRSLEQMQQQYQAAIAVRQAPISNRPVATMNAAQLKAEQSALTTALSATQGVKGYEQKSASYEQRLKAINAQLKELTQNEKAAEAAAKELQAAQEASDVVIQLTKGQKFSLDQLTNAYKALESQAGKYAGIDPAKYQKVQQALKMLETEIKKVKGELLSEKEIHDRIANSGKYSVEQLQQAYNQLQAKLNTLHTNDISAIKTTQRQMNILQKEINRATGQVSGFAKAWQTAKQNIMMYVGVFAIVNKIKTTISDLITKNKELSDSMANIRKVSQWASADVVKLTENLAKIDTRNTITTLQNLAYQGAKLGIGQYGVEGLTGFVRAAEQVQTALGEDLGEDALPALAKLTEVMGLIPKFGVEEAMQKAGSAIYQLGATSTATGRNIVEFSKRLMGLANVSGVTTDQLLGLASASDSMAIMPEVGATAFNKLFNSIHGNTEGIAKAVGLAKEELQSLLYEGRTMDALVKVFEKMNTMSMKELEGRGVFKELGSDGSRLTNVMITMANKVDMLKSHLEVSNDAFSEGKAVINEYLIQQETAAGYFERASNIWTKAFVNPEGVDIVKQLAQEWYNVSYEMTQSASTMAAIKSSFDLLAGSVKLLITYLPTLVQLMMFYGIGTILQGIVVQFNAIYRASMLAGTGVARFNAMLKTNAIALGVTAVALLISKMYELSEASKIAAEEEEKRQRIFSDAAADALQTYNEQVKALQKYDDALKKSNTSEEERNDIIRQFKNEFGSYLEKLGIEINTYKDMEQALHRVNKELKDKAFYETGQKLKASYVGDAKQAQTNALSQFMQVASKKGLSTDVMEQIVEGKAGTRQQAIVKTIASMNNGDMLSKFYTQFTQGGTKALTEDVTKFLSQAFPKTTYRSILNGLTDVANAAGNLYDTSQEVINRNGQVDKFIKDNADKYSPQISVDGAILNLKRLKELNEDKLNEALNVLRDKWKEMSENDRKTEEGKKIGDAIDQYSKQIRSLRGEGYNPPKSPKELVKEEAERKKALRAEMKEEQTQAKAIIDNIKNYYQRQINAVRTLANETNMSEGDLQGITDRLAEHMNTALANVRKAIGGEKNEWDAFKQSMRSDLYEQADAEGYNFSEELLNKVIDNNVDKLRKMIVTLSKELNQQGNVLLDQILRKATENEGKNIKMDEKQRKALLKELLAKNYTGKVDYDTMNSMEQFGIGGLTNRQDATLQQWRSSGKKEDMAAAKSFIENRTEAWYNMLATSREKFIEILKTDINQTGSDKRILTLLFGDDYEEQLSGKELEGFLSMSQSQWKQFYRMLIDYNDDWVDAQKKAYDENKNRQDYLFKNRPEIRAIDEMTKLLEQRQKEMAKSGADEGTGWFQRAGLSPLSEDPELARYMLLEEKAKQYYELMERLRQQDLVSEQMVQEAKNNMIAAQTTLQEHLIAQLNSRMAKIQEWAAPIEQFGTELGQALYDQWHNGESMNEKWQDMLKKMGLAWGQLTIKVTSELMMQKIKQKLLNKAMQTEEAIHQSTMTSIEQTGATTRELIADGSGKAKVVTEQTTDKLIETAAAEHSAEMVAEDTGMAVKENAVNTSRAAGKTLADLGWWGIPLVAVITALLNALLQAALGTSKSGSETTSSTSSSSNSIKTKLVSGMLTYDRGNVDRFAGRRKLYDDGTTQVYGGQHQYRGSDGQSYRATAVAAPADGLVTQPIATTVQGQPALVAERGPEIVIGRRTTKAIMMNEPGLIRYLANYGKSGGAQTGPRYRAFDGGNLDDITQQLPDGQTTTGGGGITAADAQKLVAAIGAFNQTVNQMQQKGIPCYINKYGSGGLIDEVKSGMKFDSKYNK